MSCAHNWIIYINEVKKNYTQIFSSHSSTTIYLTPFITIIIIIIIILVSDSSSTNSKSISKEMM
jgi:hypothetical protein